jgi:hypothetical protein
VKIFTTFAPTPSRVRGLVRLVLTRPGGRERRGRLAALFYPPQWRAKSDPLMYFRETLDAAIELGLLAVDGPGDDDLVRRSDQLGPDEHDPARIDDWLPRAAARVALREEADRPNPFARLCGWFLAQPPGGIPSGHLAIKSALKAAASRPGWDLNVDNNARLEMVIYWAKYLGLIGQLREASCEGLVAAPTPFLRAHLAEVLPPDEWVPVHRFREELGQVCPVLDGGVIRARVLEAFALDWPPNRLSDAAAYALARLEREGRIQLGSYNDARPENFLLAEGRRITGIHRPPGGDQ